METRSVPFVATGSFPKLLTEDRRLILAAALGTIFEWYDFFLYGSLAVTISKQFFSGVDETTGFMFALLAFAAGFIVRPFGAAFFGRLGDLIGRKHTFLMTMFLMGLATLSVGLLPGYARIGMAAPILLISLRLLQGLALGGEYGGAAVYVAEQAPANQRGYCTSWIQATASLGLLLSLVVILCCRLATKSAFDVWGWRIPFCFSSVLLGVSLWIRLSMKESRAFLQAKTEGKLSRAPLQEVFGKKENLRKLLIAFGGMVSGMTVVWYTAQFYALYFLIQSLRVDPMTANLLIGAALVLGSPFFILSGRLSDRIGRKPVMMAGMLLAAVTLIPMFKGLTRYANPQLAAAARANPVVVATDPHTCRFQFDLVDQRKNSSDCDKVKALLSKMGVPYTNSTLPAGWAIQIKVGSGAITGFDTKAIQGALVAANYPARADPAQMNVGMLLVLLTALIALVTLSYAPLAAALVEMFPTRIRYTALSVPYHAGVGWVGGLLPTIAFSIVVATGNIYYGLWYPVIVAALSFLIGMRYMPETRGRDLHAD
ncbi:MAG: MFS transporter [Candidatus Sulfotelmatobacter sp.]